VVQSGEKRRRRAAFIVEDKDDGQTGKGKAQRRRGEMETTARQGRVWAMVKAWRRSPAGLVLLAWRWWQCWLERSFLAVSTTTGPSRGQAVAWLGRGDNGGELSLWWRHGEVNKRAVASSGGKVARKGEGRGLSKVKREAAEIMAAGIQSWRQGLGHRSPAN
jgi:hypothetical protein